MTLLAFVMIGCAAQPSAHVETKNLSQPNEPTPKQIEQAKQRLHLLRPDMTVQQMYSTLGIKDSWICAGVGGGPASHHWMREAMLGGHHLATIIAVSSKQVSGKNVLTYRLVSVSLDGATWNANNNVNNQ